MLVRVRCVICWMWRSDFQACSWAHHHHVTDTSLNLYLQHTKFKFLPLISSQHSNYEPGKQSMVYSIWNELAMNLDKIVLTVMRFKKTINQTLWSLLADWGQLKRKRGTFSFYREWKFCKLTVRPSCALAEQLQLWVGTVWNQLNIHHYVMDAFCHSAKQRGFSQISYINFVWCKERICSKIPETQESVLGSRDECNAMHLWSQCITMHQRFNVMFVL